MTQAKINELKHSLNKVKKASAWKKEVQNLLRSPNGMTLAFSPPSLGTQEFVQIHGLCEFVLDRSQKVELVRATLQTLNAYLSWVPLGYIFEGNLIDRLLNLFPHPDFRNLALECLTEVRKRFEEG